MAENIASFEGAGRRFHYLYEVQFLQKRILRPDSMTFVIGRKTADFIVASRKVERKQCEIICSAEKWKLRNLSSNGTSIIGRPVVQDTVVDLKEDDIMKVSGVFLQFKFKVEEDEYPRRVLTIIGLIGEQLCTLVAESATPSDGLHLQVEPEASGKSIVASHETEDILRAKETIKNITVDNNLLMEELAEVKSALQKALVEKSETELRHAQVKEQMKSIQEQKLELQSVGDIVEAEFLCSVCNDLLINATSLNCSHTFCECCLEQWKKKNKICPLCRSEIVQECRSRAIDSFIEKILVHLPDEMKARRKEVMDSRKAPKKRTKRNGSGRAKRKRISVIELGTPGENQIVRLSIDISDPQNETIEIISSDDEDVYL